MKIHELLKKVNDGLRPPHMAGQKEGGAASEADAFAPMGYQSAPPTGRVPSQQDERPRH